jgi:hypothetical protein
MYKVIDYGGNDVKEKGEDGPENLVRFTERVILRPYIIYYPNGAKYTDKTN